MTVRLRHCEAAEPPWQSRVCLVRRDAALFAGIGQWIATPACGRLAMTVRLRHCEAAQPPWQSRVCLVRRDAALFAGIEQWIATPACGRLSMNPAFLAGSSSVCRFGIAETRGSR
jgi:hypothetical protein